MVAVGVMAVTRVYSTIVFVIAGIFAIFLKVYHQNLALSISTIQVQFLQVHLLWYLA
ncbi:hypothetical protein ABVN80_19545 [Acinetobacter baumannii]